MLHYVFGFILVFVGFIFYVIVKLAQRKVREVHPILWVCSALFLLYFVLMALNGAGII
jgi:AGZA family xanthine/uracil permease-like MFS transporter